MKKGVVILGIFLLFMLPFVFAQQVKVDKAVKCLGDKITKSTCAELSAEEKIFSLLAVQKCEAELLSDSKNSYECWPKSGCKIKQTAQAILALDSVGTSTEKAQAWLMSQAKNSSDVLWYLQIDTNEPSSCAISYSGSSYPITIDENKKINTNAGDCLRLSQDNYWLRIPTNCFDANFEISCDKQFKTSMIFRQTSSPTFYVSEKINSGSAGSKNLEKINSKCFSETASCDYEATLWAALALNNLDKDTSPYIPYLITTANKNEQYLPESFLYILAGSSYYNDLIAKQQGGKYWDESGDKLYDTALALYSFPADTSKEKTASMNWLLDVQESDGCWDNIRNTAFILYSVWPIKPTNVEDCETTGGYCMPEATCDGNILSANCPGGAKCCSKPVELKTCSEMDGKICDKDETCNGDVLESSTTEKCCVGNCITPSPDEKTECEKNSGTCASVCGSDEEAQNYKCEFSDDVCCVKAGIGGKSYWYIWVLSVLIILVILGIIFRDKLKFYWNKFSSGFGKPSHPPSQFPSSPSQPMQRMGIPRRQMIPNVQQRAARPAYSKPRGELDEVLKKLKEISK